MDSHARVLEIPGDSPNAYTALRKSQLPEPSGKIHFWRTPSNSLACRHGGVVAVRDERDVVSEEIRFSLATMMKFIVFPYVHNSPRCFNGAVTWMIDV